eukprot:5875143-Alexandrium_andersonii.AAC.1
MDELEDQAVGNLRRECEATGLAWPPEPTSWWPSLKGPRDLDGRQIVHWHMAAFLHNEPKEVQDRAAKILDSHTAL